MIQPQRLEDLDEDTSSSKILYLLLKNGLDFLQNHLNKDRITISDALSISLNFPIYFKEVEKLEILMVCYCMVNKFRKGLDDIDERVTEKILQELINRIDQIDYDKFD